MKVVRSLPEGFRFKARGYKYVVLEAYSHHHLVQNQYGIKDSISNVELAQLGLVELVADKGLQHLEAILPKETTKVM